MLSFCMYIGGERFRVERKEKHAARQIRKCRAIEIGAGCGAAEGYAGCASATIEKCSLFCRERSLLFHAIHAEADFGISWLRGVVHIRG